MARISDMIEEFIKLLLKESEGQLEIQRNELANYFECAPSQINYVLATRFTVDRGYYIESKRGGGGFIKIIELDMNEDDYMYYLLNERIRNKISQQEAEDIIKRMSEQDIISDREAVIIKAAITDKAIAVPASLKDMVRASILKAIITALLFADESRKNGK